MKIRHVLLCGCIGLSSLLLLDSCTGCGRRQRRQRDRQRTEQTQDSSQRNKDRKSSDPSGEADEGYLRQLAETDDYDAMLDCLFDQLKEFKRLSREYLKGNMTDKAAKRRMDEIMTRYKPVIDALERASNEGDLNFNQHKRQMQLLRGYAEEYNKVGEDMIESLM